MSNATLSPPLEGLFVPQKRELSASVWTRFYVLLKTWKEERKYMSILDDGIECYSCQRIIKMGDDAIPMILLEMRKAARTKGIQLAYWSLVLERITGGSPDTENVCHEPNLFVDAWVKYLEDNRCKDPLMEEEASPTLFIETTQSQANQTMLTTALGGQLIQWTICVGGAQFSNRNHESFGLREYQEEEELSRSSMH